jgi:uncharacterized membrane protein YeaQ/YmgE (transglycosylase-associated protein family)
MINGILTYIFIGVICNFVFDLLVNQLEVEEHRFTITERIVTTALWPIALAVFIYNFLKGLFKS